MRTLVVRPQSERSATANIRIVFTIDAHFASRLRGSGAFISRKPSLPPGHGPSGSCDLASDKVRRGSFAGPNVRDISFWQNDRSAKN